MADVSFWIWGKSRRHEEKCARRENAFARAALEAKRRDLEMRASEHHQRVAETLSRLLHEKGGSVDDLPGVDEALRQFWHERGKRTDDLSE